MRYLKSFEGEVIKTFEGVGFILPSPDEIPQNFDTDLLPKFDIPEKQRKTCLLTFSPKNKKLNYPMLSLSSGYSCPFAQDCKARAEEDPENPGKYILKSYGKFTCYSAGEEVRFPSARRMRANNFNLIRSQETKDDMVDLIQKSLDKFIKEVYKKDLKLFRVHEAGDFFNKKYFDAWMDVAKQNPTTIFYAYTKSLNYWVDRLDSIPENFKLNASEGGKFDHMIQEYGLKYSKVVLDEAEAERLGLPIDIDDTHAWKTDEPFALLVHGTQVGDTKTVYGAASYKNREVIHRLKAEKIPKSEVITDLPVAEEEPVYMGLEDFEKD